MRTRNFSELIRKALKSLYLAIQCVRYVNIFQPSEYATYRTIDCKNNPKIFRVASVFSTRPGNPGSGLGSGSRNFSGPGLEFWNPGFGVHFEILRVSGPGTRPVPIPAFDLSKWPWYRGRSYEKDLNTQRGATARPRRFNLEALWDKTQQWNLIFAPRWIIFSRPTLGLNGLGATNCDRRALDEMFFRSKILNFGLCWNFCLHTSRASN